MKSKRLRIKSLFLMDCPEDVRNPHYLQCIPKPRAIPKAYLPSVWILAVLSLAKIQALVTAYNSSCADVTFGSGPNSIASSKEIIHSWLGKNWLMAKHKAHQ